MKLVFFLHDILPSLFPDYFTDEDARLYHRRAENAARLADTIVVNSQTTASSFESRFGQNLTASNLIVAPLGVASPAKAKVPPAPHSSPISSCWVRSSRARITS